MSDKAWALEQMIKYRLQVDFSRKTIQCRGFKNIWMWDDNETSVFKAIEIAISNIRNN